MNDNTIKIIADIKYYKRLFSISDNFRAAYRARMALLEAELQGCTDNVAQQARQLVK